jgi:hypothetical protein
VYWLVPRWTNASSDAIIQSVVAQWVDQVTEITSRLGTSDPFIYLNEAAYFQKPLCATGPDNVNFLMTVAKKYDPQAVFQRLVPGGHKLSTKC